MSVIVTTFDTRTKEFSITRDGEPIENVERVEYFSNKGNIGSIEICIYSDDDDDQTQTMTRITADDRGLTETVKKDNVIESLSKALYPERFKD